MDHHTVGARKAGLPRALFCLPVLLALAAPAGAAGNDGMIDLNGDKRISYDEFVHSTAVKAIQMMDADKNGMVNRSEAAAAAARRAAETAPAPAAAPAAGPVKVAAPVPDPAQGKADAQVKGKPPVTVTVTVTGADLNGDGQVDVNEIKKPLHESPAMRKAFNDLDKNKDGYLSKSELNGVDNNPRAHAVPLISVGF